MAKPPADPAVTARLLHPLGERIGHLELRVGRLVAGREAVEEVAVLRLGLHGRRRQRLPDRSHRAARHPDDLSVLTHSVPLPPSPSFPSVPLSSHQFPTFPSPNLLNFENSSPSPLDNEHLF